MEVGSDFDGCKWRFLTPIGYLGLDLRQEVCTFVCH